jgi:hypothetical protein
MFDFPTLIIAAVAASEKSDSELGVFAPMLLCLAGFIYYAMIFSRYRNTDKRHGHEKETTASVLNMQQYDQLVEHRTNLRNSTLSGRNEMQIEGALSQAGGGGLPKIVSKAINEAGFKLNDNK